MKKEFINLYVILVIILSLLLFWWYKATFKSLKDYDDRLSLELSNGKYLDGVSTIRKILEIVKSNNEKCRYYILLGDIYFYSLKEYQRGIDSYENALKLVDGDIRKKEKIYRSLSEIYETIGDYEMAIFYLKKISDFEKDRIKRCEIDFKILKLYQSEKKYEKALIGFKRLLKEKLPLKLLCEVLFNIGVIYYMNKNFSSSIDFLSRTVKVCGNGEKNISENARLLLLDCYEFLEEYGKALDVLNSISERYLPQDKRLKKERELKEKLLLKRKNGIKFKIYRKKRS